MPTKKEATQRPTNLGEVIPPATPTAQHVPPIIPREQPGLGPAALGPAPSVWTTDFDKVRQWVRPGTSQGRFPALPTKANPQINASASSVSAKKIAPVAAVLATTTATANTAAQSKFLGLWDPTVTYFPNNQVSYFGNTYTTLTQNLNSAPPNSSWQLVGPTTLDSISDGVVYLKGTQLQMSTIIVQNASFEASTSLVSGAPPGWLANGATLSYETGSPYAGTQSLKVAASVTGGGAKTAQHWTCKAGDQFFVSAAQKSDGTSSPNTVLIFFNSAGAFISSGGATHGTGTSWSVDTASVTVPTNAVSFYITCANAAAGGAGICEFDSVLVDRFVDPTTTILPKGSTPASLSTGFTYTSTVSSINLIWTGLTIFRADGSTTAVANGSFNVTGLSAGTTYHVFPYWDEALAAVNFVNPGSGGPAGSGSLQMAYAAGSNLISQNQNLMSRLPLSNSTGFVCSTTSSGTGSGSGGGSGSCVRSDQLVEERKRGIIKILDVEIGDELRSENGFETIIRTKVMPCEIWVRILLVGGEEVIVSPSHPFTLAEGSDITTKRAADLSLSDFLRTTKGVGTIKQISVLEMKEQKVSISTDGPSHTFFAGKDAPSILVHNIALFS
jgi:hypothetical protein